MIKNINLLFQDYRIKLFIALLILFGIGVSCCNSDENSDSKNDNNQNLSIYDKGILEIQNKNYTEALALLNKIKKKDKNYKDAQSKINFVKGIQFYNQSNYDIAIEFFNKVDVNDVFYADVQKYLNKINFENNKYHIAIGLLNANRVDTALIIFESISSNDSNFVNAQSKINFIRGNKEFEAGNDEQAITYFKKVSTTDIFYDSSVASINAITENKAENTRNLIIIIVLIIVVVATFIFWRYKRKKLFNQVYDKIDNYLKSNYSNISDINHDDIINIFSKFKIKTNSQIMIDILPLIYKEQLNYIAKKTNIDDNTSNTVKEIRRILNVKANTQNKIDKDFGISLYKKALSQVLSDLKVTNEEIEKLQKIENLFYLDHEFVTDIFESKVKEVFSSRLENTELDKIKKDQIELLRKNLRLPINEAEEIVTNISREQFIDYVYDKIVNHELEKEQISDLIDLFSEYNIRYLLNQYDEHTVRNKLMLAEEILENEVLEGWALGNFIEKAGELDTLKGIEDIHRVVVRKTLKQGDYKNIIEYIYGQPDEISKKVVGNKTRETWKYKTGSEKRSNSFNNQIIIENGRVIGWVDK